MIELSSAASVLAVFFVIALMLQLRSIEQRLGAIAQLNAKLDVILTHLGVTFDPYKDVPAGVVESLQRGDKIEAIKRYREFSGTSLRSAKEFVEEVQRRGGLPA